jgi:thioredoxin 1
MAMDEDEDDEQDDGGGWRAAANAAIVSEIVSPLTERCAMPLLRVLVIGLLAVAAGCRPHASAPAYDGPSSMVEITSIQQFQETVAAQPVVLVDFNATWCGPCRMLHPILANLSETYKGRVTMLSVDTDNHEQLAAQYQVRALPTVVILHQGKEVERFVGLESEATYIRSLDKLAPATPGS